MNKITQDNVLKAGDFRWYFSSEINPNKHEKKEKEQKEKGKSSWNTHTETLEHAGVGIMIHQSTSEEGWLLSNKCSLSQRVGRLCMY